MPPARCWRAGSILKGGGGGGRKEKFGRINAEKVGARLASPQPRPAIAGQWGRGDNRLRDDAPAKRSFQRPRPFFQVFSPPLFFLAGRKAEKPLWFRPR